LRFIANSFRPASTLVGVEKQKIGLRLAAWTDCIELCFRCWLACS
jgi:hypothetical protein